MAGKRETAFDRVTRLYYRLYARYDAAAIADSLLGRGLLRAIGMFGSAAFVVRGHKLKPWFVRRSMYSVRSIMAETSHRHEGKFPLPPGIADLQDLKVACVADGFTALAYSFECRMVQLRADDWQEKVESFQPHLLFVESAWDGKGESWKWKVSILSPEIVSLVHWCKKRGIPTIFWNKEDPRHFETFIRTAALFDHVLTTDVDKVPDYRERLGTDQVHLLPFAAQTAIHNPIELFERQDSFCFAGSYYTQQLDRNSTFSKFVEALSSMGELEIYDRYMSTKDERMIFPRTYDRYIKGTLPPAEIERAYKSYVYGVNMNTVKTSRSMFARRVYELMASNTVVMSNYSLGQVNILGQLTICTDDIGQLKARIHHLQADRVFREKYCLAALRQVMAHHTYRHRLQYIASLVFDQPLDLKMPTVAVIGAPRNQEELQRVVDQFNAQTYERKELWLVAPPGHAREAEGAKVISAEDARAMTPGSLGADQVCLFDPRDHYGKNYLADLALGAWWSGAEAVGKGCFLTGSGASIVSDGQEYRFVGSLPWRSAMVSARALEQTTVGELVRMLHEGEVALPVCLSLDRFNYCRDFVANECPAAEDLPIEDRGIPLDELDR